MFLRAPDRAPPEQLPVELRTKPPPARVARVCRSNRSASRRDAAGLGSVQRPRAPGRRFDYHRSWKRAPPRETRRLPAEIVPAQPRAISTAHAVVGSDRLAAIAAALCRARLVRAELSLPTGFPRSLDP